MEWKMVKPSIPWDFDAFQGRTYVNLHEESKGLLPCTLSCMQPYQKASAAHAHHLSSATPSSSGTTAATAGASLDSGSSDIIPAINLKEICQKREFIVRDYEEPEKQQYYSERYVDASCTAKAPPPPPPPLPPSAAVTVLPYSERRFAQEKRIHPLDQSSPLSKGLTIASSSDDPVNLKIKQQRTTFTAPVMDHPVLRCQIDGCKEDLSKAKKDYHRRHKVCEMHSKAPGVIKSGLEQRFCQQCSRFHVVGEFDDTKRSCRRRLEGHNRRRRKSNNYQGTASSFSVGSIFHLGHDKLILNHLMQPHQPEVPLPRMQFYRNNEGMLRRAVGWPIAGFQEEEEEQQQQGMAMGSLPADFNEINSRLRAVLNYGQINKGSSSSLSLLGLQQQEAAFSCLGKALSLCTTTNGSTCALSLLSPHALPEPVIPDQVTLDEKLPNRLNYPPNHHHQNLTSAGVGLISSDHSMVHPQSALPLANQPTSLALSMGTSDVSSGIKEEFYQTQVSLAAPSPCNYENMGLIPSLAPNNPFLARLLHEAANRHQYQQLDTAIEVNAEHLQPPQGFANSF